MQTQLARAQGLQRQFEQADRMLDEVASAGAARSSRVRAREALERGRVRNSAGQPERSLPYFREALDLALAAGEEALAVDAAHMIAIAIPDDEQKLAWNERALVMARGSEDPRAQRWIGSLLNNIGWTHFAAGRTDDALRIFGEHVHWLGSRGDAAALRIARYAVGRVLRAQGKHEEALALQRHLYDEWTAASVKPPYVTEEIAECLQALGRAHEARPFYASAYEELSKDPWLVTNERARLARLKKLSGV